MTTDIQNFFKNKKIFLTGGTGFLGKVLIEKLLRSTEVQRIYILTRSKRGRDLNDRLNDILNDPLFSVLVKTKPDVNHKDRITAISGDCTLPNLGLSASDTQTLIDEVEIVIHSAATVRFNEPLSVAVATNVRATMDLIKLAKKMQKLKSFVHVSSAFANCPVMHIEERYYVNELNISAESICNLLEKHGSRQVDIMDEGLRGKFPNTYCFSKALAEDVVLTEGSNLPICIFRPGIVIPTYKEPISGWIDNLYGPTSILLGVAYGVLRVIHGRMNSNATLVPVDYCANVMMAIAWRTSQKPPKTLKEPPIFNLVPDSTNLLNWKEYHTVLQKYGQTMPLSRMFWYPFLIGIESKTIYTFVTFFLHTLPGYLMDFGLWLKGQKLRMVHTYRKIHKQTDAVEYFILRDWTFGMQNTKALWTQLSAKDKTIFPFDMSALDWSQYFYNSVIGVRLYLAKEEPETIPKGLKLLNRLRILHRTLQTILFGGSILLTFWIVRRALELFYKFA